MGLLKPQDHIALATVAGERMRAREVPDLRTIPWGYYLKRNGKIGRLQADHLFQGYYRKAKGHEFLCLESEYPLETVEACVYLRQLEALGLWPEPEVETEPTPKLKRTKRTKKGGK